MLCIQEDAADHVLTMIKGAMKELSVGCPDLLSTDVGPVIDAQARQIIERHILKMRQSGHVVEQLPMDAATEKGTFVSPAIIELNDISELEREVFGPVLHVVRYKRQELDALVDKINATGYGLTFGIHSRIDETIARVSNRIHAGNIYVNRNIVGAVVGVQPFGGQGLSGTGPKAGGLCTCIACFPRATTLCQEASTCPVSILPARSCRAPPGKPMSIAWCPGVPCWPGRHQSKAHACSWSKF